MNSIITITFNEDLVVGKNVIFQINDSSDSSFQGIIETYATIRITQYQASIKPTLPVVGASSASSFLNAFNLDYNSSEIYTATAADNVVTIEAQNGFITFSNATSNGNVTFSITNFSGTVFQITQAIFEQATDACNNVKLKATTNVYADNIHSPIGTTTRSGNIIYIDIRNLLENVCVSDYVWHLLDYL